MTENANIQQPQTKETGVMTDLELAVELAASYETIPRMQANIRFLLQEITARKQRQDAVAKEASQNTNIT